MKRNKSAKSKLSLLFTGLIVIVVFILTSYISEYTAALKAQQSLHQSSCNIIGSALFSPDDNIQNTLIYLIDNEQKKISTAIFTLTQKDVAKAFINAKNRGVQLEFVVDRGYGNDRFSRIPQLANHRIPIWVYQFSPSEKLNSLMHNKFCIFEENIDKKRLLWTGSYNFTQSANLRNQENVLIIENESLIKKFQEQFDILKTRSILISGEKSDLNNNYNNNNIAKHFDDSDDCEDKTWDKAFCMIKKLFKYIK